MPLREAPERGWTHTYLSNSFFLASYPSKQHTKRFNELSPQIMCCDDSQDGSKSRLPSPVTRIASLEFVEVLGERGGGRGETSITNVFSETLAAKATMSPKCFELTNHRGSMSQTCFKFSEDCRSASLIASFQLQLFVCVGNF